MYHFFMLTSGHGLVVIKKEKSTEVMLRSSRTTSSGGASAPALTFETLYTSRISSSPMELGE